jgi:hypothetical protein
VRNNEEKNEEIMKRKINANENTAVKADGIPVAKANGIPGNKKWEKQRLTKCKLAP